MAEIEARHVGKSYRAKERRAVLAVDALRLIALRRSRYRMFEALKDVSFDVDRGESFGIIGANGSGKSTLLRILAGVTVPSTGTVRVRGSVSSMLELGAGFHQELTGRENVWLSAAMLGLSRKAVRSKLDEIVAFAELEPFIDQPVFTYSSGMHVRLGFSIAIALDPDVLILDEVLAVGDQAFRAKSHAAIQDFKKRGKTIVLVSHDLHEVISFCGRALLLNEGVPVLIDSAAKVVPFYTMTVGPKGGQHYATVGPLTMAFSGGRLLFFHDGISLTQPPGFYFSIAVARSWFDSTHAAWTIAEASGSRFVAEGSFTTLPLDVSLSAAIGAEDGVNITLRARIRESFGVEQYHASTVLQAGYQRWSTDSESGEFPAITVAAHEWAHVNASPLSGKTLVGEGPTTLQTVLFRTTNDNFAPTVLNTDHAGNGRVLQFLDARAARWDTGVRTLFEGTLTFGRRV